MSDESQIKKELPQTEAAKPAHAPKKRDRSASEDRLIQAGLEVFSKYGFDGATTKMIAKKADVNESLIARYFDGKEGLLVAIITRFLEEIQARELTYPPQETLAEEMVMYIAERLNEGCSKIEFARIIFSQALVNKKFRKRVMETAPMVIDPRMISRVKILKEKGKLAADSDPVEICEIFDTYLDGAFFHDLVLNEKNVDDIIAKALIFAKRIAASYQ